MQSRSHTQIAIHLMDSAEQLTYQGQHPEALLYANRAKFYLPDNPNLWLRLANYYNAQKRYKQAESCALRIIRFSTDDTRMRIKGWRLIEQVRLMLGDEESARYATNRANELENQPIFLHN